jgi:acyl-CoA thioester hydrolase
MDDAFEHTVPVRYRDLDTYGHVNNVVYGTYCEEARVAYLREVLPIDDADDLSMVVVSLSIDFRASVTEMTNVDVAVAVARMGDSSFTMEYEVSQDDRVVAEAETTQAYIDPEVRETRPLPDEWRERVAEFEGLDG